MHATWYESNTGKVESQTDCSSSVLLPPAFFSGGEKVPEADEGALALAMQWNVSMNS